VVELLLQRGLIALTVHGEGTATGSIVDRASFMRLRDQREPPREPVLDIVGDDEDRAEATTTDFKEGVVWLVDRSSRSWASHTHHSADVHQDEYPVLLW
jgi:hypothetical protein